MNEIAKQQTSEWYSERLGILTSTRAAALMGTRGARDTLMAEILAEYATAKGKEIYRSAAMERGIRTETEALSFYEFMYAVNITVKGAYIISDQHPMLGDSPDGLVGETGIVEVKCLDRHNHIRVMLSGQIDKKHEHQIYWHLFINSDRNWCDYFGYCPDLPVSMKGFKKRYYRDNEIIRKYEDEAFKFIHELQGLLIKYDLIDE